jgi:hypothetical protein
MLNPRAIPEAYSLKPAELFAELKQRAGSGIEFRRSFLFATLLV